MLFCLLYINQLTLSSSATLQFLRPAGISSKRGTKLLILSVQLIKVLLFKRSCHEVTEEFTKNSVSVILSGSEKPQIQR